MAPVLRFSSPLWLAPTGGTGRSAAIPRALPRRPSVLAQVKGEPRQLSLFGPPAVAVRGVVRVS
ncbi:MAG: hypothetical protein ABI641_10450 [Caldimonas sp.]